jgi:putative transposase
MTENTPSPLNNVITIDDERIKNHLDRVVRGSVEETLNALLEAETDRLCNARRYERSEARRDTRAGHYERKLQTKAGEVRLKVPKLRAQTFETAIIERYRRRESSVEEALIEMYLAGVSVRRVDDITEALWRTRVSPSTVTSAFETHDCSADRKWTNNDVAVSVISIYDSEASSYDRPRYLSQGHLWVVR